MKSMCSFAALLVMIVSIGCSKSPPSQESLVEAFSKDVITYGILYPADTVTVLHEPSDLSNALLGFEPYKDAPSDQNVWTNPTAQIMVTLMSASIIDTEDSQHPYAGAIFFVVRGSDSSDIGMATYEYSRKDARWFHLGF
ncbi:MAG: hypothetical protein JW958_09030 [Candidatus Eisenbacteria bacterium]|nr:hypothetical protein [Candidatus Eisenbacteria bacterium]